MMLKITYKTAADANEMTKEYAEPAAFLHDQYLEVPPLQDYYHVVEATLDGQAIELKDQTIDGLFNQLNQK